MKQAIAPEQIRAELPEAEYCLFITWAARKRYVAIASIPVGLTIGMMIEFLYEHRSDPQQQSLALPGCHDGMINPELVCDDLWMSVKDVLAHNHQGTQQH